MPVQVRREPVPVSTAELRPGKPLLSRYRGASASPGLFVTGDRMERSGPTVDPRTLTRCLGRGVLRSRPRMARIGLLERDRRQRRLHQSAGPTGRHWWPDLKPADLGAVLAPDPQRRPWLAEAGVNHRSQVQLRPVVTTRTVGVEPVAVLEQSDEGAEVDHRATPVPRRVHRASPDSRRWTLHFAKRRSCCTRPDM